jgi:hypothetical protein
MGEELAVTYDFSYFSLTEPSKKLYLFCFVIVSCTKTSSYVRTVLECELLFEGVCLFP